VVGDRTFLGRNDGSGWFGLRGIASSGFIGARLPLLLSANRLCRTDQGQRAQNEGAERALKLAQHVTAEICDDWSWKTVWGDRFSDESATDSVSRRSEIMARPRECGHWE
jgi:hypothetical protein